MVKSLRKMTFVIVATVFALAAAFMLYVGLYPEIEAAAAELADVGTGEPVTHADAIEGWTYGDKDVTVSIPDEWADNASATFELQRNGTVIKRDITAEQFSDYVNGTMPSGEYILIARDGAAGETSVTTSEYEFTVEKADMVFGLSASDVGDGYDIYEWELNVADKSDFFSVFMEKVDVVGVKLMDVTPEGYWATVEEQYYGSYTVKYNLDRMHNEQYYTADDDTLRDLIEPGKYVVYFQVTANNHNDLVDMNDSRRDYRFTVTVYETVPKPLVVDTGLVYTGEKMLPTVAESPRYRTIYSPDDDYASGGYHKIYFELYDSDRYRWEGWEEMEEDDQGVYTVIYKIESAQNTWVRVPNIVGWKYDSFDADAIRMPAVPRFGSRVVFTVVTEEQGAGEGAEPAYKLVNDALTAFTAEADGTITDQAVLAALNRLPAGNYFLNAFVEETIDYNVLSEYVLFTVSKANNAWSDEDEFLLPAWVEGKYDPDENVISILPMHGAENLKIIITDLDGKEYYNSVSGLNKLKDTKAGKYLLTAWVDETENYDELARRTFTIEVLEKVGLPWWATLSITLGALLAAALVIFLLWKNGVFGILTGKIAVAIRTRATVEATIAAVRAAKMEEEGKKSVAKAKRKDAARARAKARAEEMAKPADERAAALEAKAMAEAAKAEKIRERAEKLQEEAAKVRGEQTETPKDESAQAAAEEAAATAPETPADETVSE